MPNFFFILFFVDCRIKFSSFITLGRVIYYFGWFARLRTVIQVMTLLFYFIVIYLILFYIFWDLFCLWLECGTIQVLIMKLPLSYLLLEDRLYSSSQNLFRHLVAFLWSSPLATSLPATTPSSAYPPSSISTHSPPSILFLLPLKCRPCLILVAASRLSQHLVFAFSTLGLPYVTNPSPSIPFPTVFPSCSS